LFSHFPRFFLHSLSASREDEGLNFSISSLRFPAEAFAPPAHGRRWGPLWRPARRSSPSSSTRAFPMSYNTGLAWPYNPCGPELGHGGEGNSNLYSPILTFRPFCTTRNLFGHRSLDPPPMGHQEGSAQDVLLHTPATFRDLLRCVGVPSDQSLPSVCFPLSPFPNTMAVQFECPFDLRELVPCLGSRA